MQSAYLRNFSGQSNIYRFFFKFKRVIRGFKFFFLFRKKSGNLFFKVVYALTERRAKVGRYIFHTA